MESIKFAYIVKSGKVGRETAMSAKDLSFDNSGEGEVIEEISKHFPDVVVFILADAFVVESVGLSDGARLVVAPQDGNSVFVPKSVEMYLILRLSMRQMVSTE